MDNDANHDERNKPTVCIVGGGISGLVYCDVLQRMGFAPTVFEASSSIGGIWFKTGYPKVSLQNTGSEYVIPDYPWPFTPSRHPTASEILSYLREFVSDRNLLLELNTLVVSTEQQPDGAWKVRVVNTLTNDTIDHEFDYLVVAVGQFHQEKNLDRFLSNKNEFQGKIVTEQDIRDETEMFDNKRVVVVGLGKSALDMATLACGSGAQSVDHVFRSPHWILPRSFFGLHYTHFLFPRISTVMMPGWGHPTQIERILHSVMYPVVFLFWLFIQGLIYLHVVLVGKNAQERKRIRSVLPDNEYLIFSLRSALALDPEDSWYGRIARNEIVPHHASLVSFTGPDTLEIKMKSDGSTKELHADVVVLSTGVGEPPKFPFMDPKYKQLLESDDDGVQLFHHIFHPQISNFAFAGFNHGFMHVPSSAIGALYVASVWRKEMELPPAKDMEDSIQRIQKYKRKYVLTEPSRACAVNTRFQQHNDILLKELHLNPYRKHPNAPAEVFLKYSGSDFNGIVDEYLERRSKYPKERLSWSGVDA